MERGLGVLGILGISHNVEETKPVDLSTASRKEYAKTTNL